MVSASESFFAQVPGFSGFDAVLQDDLYVPLPGDWALAVADVVGSTAAIEAGHYKQVNFAGAAVICAVQNVVGARAMPFAFGGDGAVVAVAPEEIDAARTALARVRRWSGDDLGLELRAALVPVAAVREAGHDVLLGRHVAGVAGYAMFSGGGVRWADGELKAGRFAVAAAPGGQAPDLTGLSCRWMPVRSRNGVILSVIVEPATGADPGVFRRHVEGLLAILAREDRAGHPIPQTGPPPPMPLRGLRLELRATGDLRTFAAETGFSWLSAGVRRPVRGYDVQAYRADVAANSDFRKFDDALKLTVDVSPAVDGELERLLDDGARAGVCRYGLHRQSEALLTCIVPAMRERDHVHFIDGAAGGYALAAAAMKQQAGA